MTLRELIQQSSFKPVFNSLYRNYYKNFSDDEINQYSLSYSKVYDFLRNLKPTGNLNYKIYISEREEINFKDEEPEKFVDVGLYDEKKDEVLAIDLTSWSEIIDLEIKDTLNLNKYDALGHILWEITFYGFTVEQINNYKKTLQKASEEESIPISMPELLKELSDQ